MIYVTIYGYRFKYYNFVINEIVFCSSNLIFAQLWPWDAICPQKSYLRMDQSVVVVVGQIFLQFSSTQSNDILLLLN